MAMEGRVVFVFLVLVATQAINGERMKSKGSKPEVGKKDCEWYMSGDDVDGVWEGAFKRDCKLDSKNHTIFEKSKSHNRWLPDLYDTCCTEYIGLVCRPYKTEKGMGYCAKPEPYFGDRKWNRERFLRWMKQKKLDDGQQLDERWDVFP